MTRKHYLLIAQCLRYDMDNAKTEAEAAAARFRAERFAIALQKDNPNFNKDRFLAAAIGV